MRTSADHAEYDYHAGPPAEMEQDAEEALRTLATGEPYTSNLRARLAATENVALALGAMNHPPCFICGYNGPSYYQPEVHLCAERHHKYYYGKLTAFSELRALLAEGGER